MKEQFIKDKTNLRLKAEEILSNSKHHSTESLSEADALKQLHELEVSKIELELQNEELRIAKEQAEHAAKKSIELYKLLKDSEEQTNALILGVSMDGFFKSDLQWRFLEVNDTYCQMSGYTREELLSMNIHDVECLDDPDKIADRTLKIIAQGEDRFESQYRKKDGTIIDVETNIHFRPETGNQFVGFLHDITERKLAERALKKSERRYTTLFENKINGIAHCKIITDQKGQPIDYIVLQINEAYERIIGIRKESIEGKRILEVFPDIKNYAIDYIGMYGKIALENGEISFEEFFEATQQYLSIYAYSPDPGEFIAIFTDITQRIVAEESLRQSEKRHRLLSETILQGIVHQDAQGRILYINPAAEQILGKDNISFFENGSAEIVHHPIREDGSLFPYEEFPATVTLQSGTAIQNIVMGIFTPPKNETRWICIDSVPLFRSGELFPYEVYTIFEDITERKQSEQIINYHAGLIANISDAIISTDENFMIKSWNSGAEAIYGWRKDEIIGKSVREILQTEFNDDLSNEAVVDNFHQSSIWRGEVIQKRKDNSSVHILSSVKELRDQNGNFTGAVSVNRDITEKKESEKALQVSEQKFKKLINEMEVGVILNSPQSDIILCNPKAQELLGLSEDQLLGKTPWDPHWKAIHEDGSPFPGEMHPAPQVIATGKAVKNVVMGVFQPQKGDHTWFLINAQPQINEDGSLNQVITTFIDITQQVKTENALRESEFFFRESQKAGFIGSFKADLNTGLSEFSEVQNEIFGLEKDFKLSLQAWLDFIHPEDRPLVDKYFREEVIEKGIPFDIEYRIITKNDHITKWVHVQGKIDFNEARNTRYLVGTVQDITRRKTKEKKLHQLNKALKALSKSSQAMAHAVNEFDYLQEVCKIVVEDTDFVLVWIGYAEEDEAKTIRPVASAGFEDNYLEIIHVSWADNEFGRGPGGKAVRTGKMSICKNVLTDPEFKPWSEQAIQRGYASNIAFPLKSGNKTFGVFSIYSKQPDSFLEEEIDILSKLANDLAHGIATIRLRASQQALEQALIKSHGELEELVKQRTAELANTNEALQLTEAKYRTIADFATNWEFWISPSDRMIYCSPACEQITGYPATDFLINSHLLVDIIHPDDLSIFLKHQKEEKLAIVDPQELQYRIYRKDGMVRWIGHFCRPVFDESNNFKGIRGSNKDITDRKNTEELLKISNRKYRLLSANITDGIFIYKDGGFEYVNSAMSQIFGYEIPEFKGMNLVQLINPSQLDKLDFLNHFHSLSNQAHNVEFECVRIDQSIIYVEFLFNFVASENVIYGVVHDITEKKQMQTNILKAIILTEENERANFSKELHDGLGPLLSTIKMYLQWSKRPKTNKSPSEIIRKAEDILEEALTTVKEISNKISPHLLTNYGLSSAIQNFVGKVEETSTVQIDFESNLVRRLSNEIEAAFYRATIECINNTLKYAHASSIFIKLVDSGQQLHLQYKDNGHGFNLEETLLSKKGLGLYNLQNRIETIGGKISLYSSPGHGVDYQITVNLI